MGEIVDGNEVVKLWRMPDRLAGEGHSLVGGNAFAKLVEDE